MDGCAAALLCVVWRVRGRPSELCSRPCWSGRSFPTGLGWSQRWLARPPGGVNLENPRFSLEPFFLLHLTVAVVAQLVIFVSLSTLSFHFQPLQHPSLSSGHTLFRLCFLVLVKLDSHSFKSIETHTFYELFIPPFAFESTIPSFLPDTAKHYYTLILFHFLGLPIGIHIFGRVSTAHTQPRNTQSLFGSTKITIIATCTRQRYFRYW